MRIFWILIFFVYLTGRCALAQQLDSLDLTQTPLLLAPSLRYLRSPGHPLAPFRLIPVRLYTPEQLRQAQEKGELEDTSILKRQAQENKELEDTSTLNQQPRQQQIVQEVVINNSGGGGGFGRPPPFGGPGFGRPPPFGGPGFGPDFGRPSRFGPGRGFGGGGGFGGGFSGSFGGGFGGGFRERSYAQEQPQEQPKADSDTYAETISVPPCPQSFVFSCGPVLKEVPCAAAEAY